MTVRADQIGAPDACVANLPYNVAVPVLLHLLEVSPSLRHGLVMVQSEVADRLAAPPGSRTYGIPSAKAAWYADLRRAGPVGRNVFWPAPNVDSGLVAFERHEPPQTAATREQVFAVIDAAFSQRRKTVRSALARWLPDRDRLDEVFRIAGTDPGLRGEMLGIADFARIAGARADAGH
jgi:16S rRNA (adenine1518-N6/adenine1519-N6)-dimethyltransferase